MKPVVREDRHSPEAKESGGLAARWLCQRLGGHDYSGGTQRCRDCGNPQPENVELRLKFWQ